MHALMFLLAPSSGNSSPKKGENMFSDSKKVITRVLIVYAMFIQLFSAPNIAMTVAQAPSVKDIKQGRKEKKISKKQIVKLKVSVALHSKNNAIANIKNAISLYKRKASAHKAAKLKAEEIAQIYLARLGKEKDAKTRLSLISSRTKTVKSAQVHNQKFVHFTHKVAVLTEKLFSFNIAKQVLVGRASWYASGSRTANGERFNPNALTAAMRGFRGKRVKVVNLSNNKSVIVRINDHGPAKWTGRVIDLSRGSFSKIASTSQGVISRVKLYVY